jgi:CO/xanthine dehydrogenase Mo-binding subunit
VQSPRHLRVLAPDVGGGFGQKVEIWPEDVACSYLAMTLNRPIKWIESQRENLLAYHGRGEVECLGVMTNKPPTGPYRGAGGPEGAYFMERTVDLVARELALDPADVRRINFIPADTFPYTTGTGLNYDSGQFEKAFARALELAAETLETPSPTNPLGLKGVGELPTVACPVAVVHAVVDALSHTQVHHLDAPLTHEKIWRALQQT